MVEERRVELRALELAQEAVAEHLKPAEGHVLRHCQCVARSALVLVAVHDGDEAVGGGLGPDVLAWEVAAEEVPDERGLAHRVLSHEQYHWLRLEVAVREQRRVEVAEAVKLLDRAHLRPVQLLQPIRHAFEHLGDLLLLLRHGTAPLASLTRRDTSGSNSWVGVVSIGLNQLFSASLRE